MSPAPALLEAVVASTKVFGTNRVGVYLHGSAVLGGYDPRVSDLDYLVVCLQAPTVAEKLAFMRQTAATVLPLAPAKGIELHVLVAAALTPFHHPCPFAFHYSRQHQTAWQRDPAGYVRGMHGVDRDLAAHVTVVEQAGRVLIGAPIREVFAPVPRDAYLDSVWGDLADAQTAIQTAPVYTVLNLCRTLGFLADGHLRSKLAGGQWALTTQPEPFHPVIRAAVLAVQTGTAVTIPAAALADFAAWALARLKEAGLPNNEMKTFSP